MSDITMNQDEKCQFLKEQIEYLYEKEGRSISYISRLFKIQRYAISKSLKEWQTPKPKPMTKLTPSQQKFVNKHRQTIIQMLDTDNTAIEIADRIGCTKAQLEQIYLVRDKALAEANRQKSNRRKAKATIYQEEKMRESARNYDFHNLPGEQWKPILGYESYEISTKGRIRVYAKSYHSFYLKKPWLSKDGYVRVTITKNDSTHKQKTLLLHRLVAQTFIPHNSSLTVVNHKNGNKEDNAVDNLEWVTPSDNNKHYYNVLKDGEITHSRQRKTFKEYAEYKGIHFRSMTELAQYMGISRATLARRMKTPDKYGIKIH